MAHKEPKPIDHKLEDSVGPGMGLEFEEWVASVRKRSGKCLSQGNLHGLPLRDAMPPKTSALIPSPRCGTEVPDWDKHDGSAAKSHSPDQVPEVSLRDKLGNAATLDVEASDISWDTLYSLHHTKYTSSNEHSEDELNKALEVTVNSGGVVFFALFNTLNEDDLLPKEAAAVIKIAPSRMATQSERLGYEFARLLGVKTPQARVIHNSSTEWQLLKDATEKARDMTVDSGDEVGAVTCSELLEALELSRCLLLMNYCHGSPLVENSIAFDSKVAAKNTAAALGRVLMLDLVLRNEDRLPCPQLGWRGNQANLLFSTKVASANMDALVESYDCRRNKPRIAKSLRKERAKERRASSINGGLGSQGPELTAEDSDDCIEFTDRSINNQATDYGKKSNFHIVAIDSLVPRRPPAGKRARDLESYPRVVELIINNYEFSSNLLYEVSFGKLGFPGPEHTDAQIDSSSLPEFDMVAVVHAFRQGFRAALRDLQSFHIFLLTLYQKLEGLFRVLLAIINKCFSESDKDDSGAAESPSNSSWCSFNAHFQACKEHGAHETHADSSDPESRRCSQKSSEFRESIDIVSPVSRDTWNGRCSKGGGEAPRSLRLTMKLRDFNKCTKVDAELSKELEQWNEMLKSDVVRLCQENNFNTGFFEGNDNTIAVDAYELKVRLEHILERISLISDAASTEQPSPITEYLYIGGALAAKSMYTLQHLGITHILCLCANEIGQSDSQNPDLFEYRNFSVCDNDDEDISNLFEEASDFIDYVERLGGKILVHCFEGKSRSATVVLAYLMLRKDLTLLEAWNMLKKSHRRAQPNDGFAKTLLDLDEQLHGKTSMEWQQRKPMMKVCPICKKNAGLSSSSLKLHLQKYHRMLSSGSVDSAMTLETQKSLEALKINRLGSTSQTRMR